MWVFYYKFPKKTCEIWLIQDFAYLELVASKPENKVYITIYVVYWCHWMTPDIIVELMFKLCNIQLINIL